VNGKVRVVIHFGFFYNLGGFSRKGKRKNMWVEEHVKVQWYERNGVVYAQSSVVDIL
jgi:hypothetical protein